jgi:hypothetical protein
MKLLCDRVMGQKWHACTLGKDRKYCVKTKYRREQICFTKTTGSFCAAMINWTAAAFHSLFLP